MNKKELILNKLNFLKELYKNNEDKKWNLKAITIAISAIKIYEGNIISGCQMQKDIKGIGTKISKRIDEILETGDLKELAELNNITVNNSTNNNTSNNNTSNNNSPNNNNDYLNNLLDITGIGMVRAKKWIEIGIKNIEDVRQAIVDKKIDSTHHIDIGIKYYEDLKKKIPRDEIDKIKVLIKDVLGEINKDLIFDICGSYRRGKLESGDIDILITHTNYKENIKKYKFLEIIVKKFKDIHFIVDSLTEKGETKYMGICKLKKTSIGRRIDIRVVDYQSYYPALLYFTGNKDFNIYIRKEALKNSCSLNEYGMMDIRDNSIIFMKSEEEIFNKLKIKYLSPEERDKF